MKGLNSVECSSQRLPLAVVLGLLEPNCNRARSIRLFHAEWNRIFQHHRSHAIPAWELNISRQYLLDKLLKNNDEVVVVSTVSCLIRKNLTRIHDSFKLILPSHLPDRLKNYYREILKLQTFLEGDYANRANTYGKFGTTSPQFFRKADPWVFVEDRQSTKGSNCDKTFCIQCSIDSPPSYRFQAQLEELGQGRNIKCKKKFPEFPNFLEKGQPQKVQQNFGNEFPTIFCSI